jgi:hypothetical protein
MKIFQGVNKLLTVFMLLCVNGTTECSSVLLLKNWLSKMDNCEKLRLSSSYPFRA